MSVIDTLITDRSQADIAAQLALEERIRAGTATPEEQAEYCLGKSKGSYNASDLNRVEEATAFVRDAINGIQGSLDEYRAGKKVASDPAFNVPYSPIAEIQAKTDWDKQDIPKKSDMERYLQNVDAVTDPIEVEKSLPADMEDLTFQEANEIERALMLEYEAGLDLEAEKKTLIDKTEKAFIYSGEIFAGEF